MVVGGRPVSLVAFGAFHFGVEAEKGIPRGRVILHRKSSWLPALFAVACSTFAFFPGGKLTLVFVLVTIQAKRVRDGRAEVIGPMTLRAVQGSVLTLQGEYCFRVIKTTGAQTCRLPSARGVAPLAIAGEGSAVGIFVAGFAGVDGTQVPVLNRTTAGQGAVTLAAIYFLMLPCEGESGSLMREGRRRLPGFQAMATSAVCAQTATVGIVVATHATSGEAEKRLVQIGPLQGRSIFRCDL